MWAGWHPWRWCLWWWRPWPHARCSLPVASPMAAGWRLPSPWAPQGSCWVRASWPRMRHLFTPTSNRRLSRATAMTRCSRRSLTLPQARSGRVPWHVPCAIVSWSSGLGREWALRQQAGTVGAAARVARLAGDVDHAPILIGQDAGLIDCSPAGCRGHTTHGGASGRDHHWPLAPDATPLVLCCSNNTRVFGTIPPAKTACSPSPNWRG